MKTTITAHAILAFLLAAALRAEEPIASPAGIASPAEAPCRIVQTEKPQFPVRLIKEGVTHGTVKVLVQVDATGTIIDQLVIASTRHAFAEEAQRVIGTWMFQPARIHGEPTDTVLDLTFTFDVSGLIYVDRFGTSEPPPGVTQLPFEYHACALSDLDRMPTPLALAQPLYPEEWREQGIAGRVTVQFYIDETGRARFPTVLAGDHDHLSAVAVAAVRQWRFAPPTSKGKPVLVRARQVFAFGLEKAPAA